MPPDLPPLTAYQKYAETIAAAQKQVQQLPGWRKAVSPELQSDLPPLSRAEREGLELECTINYGSALWAWHNEVLRLLAEVERLEKAILSVPRHYVAGVGSICNFCQGYECREDCAQKLLREKQNG